MFYGSNTIREVEYFVTFKDLHMLVILLRFNMLDAHERSLEIFSDSLQLNISAKR